MITFTEEKLISHDSAEMGATILLRVGMALGDLFHLVGVYDILSNYLTPRDLLVVGETLGDELTTSSPLLNLRMDIWMSDTTLGSRFARRRFPTARLPPQTFVAVLPEFRSPLE